MHDKKNTNKTIINHFKKIKTLIFFNRDEIYKYLSGN